VLYQLSYGPLISNPRGAEAHGQGQNRTADTMIFSHVLYQLSYLAGQKNRPGLFGARTGNLPGEAWVLEALRSRPHPRAPRIRDGPEQESRRVHSCQGNPGSPARPTRRDHLSSRLPLRGKRRQCGGASGRVAGAGFEPATFGL
jgi:hypothetical protein